MATLNNEAQARFALLQVTDTQKLRKYLQEHYAEAVKRRAGLDFDCLSSSSSISRTSSTSSSIERCPRRNLSAAESTLSAATPKRFRVRVCKTARTVHTPIIALASLENDSFGRQILVLRQGDHILSELPLEEVKKCRGTSKGLPMILLDSGVLYC